MANIHNTKDNRWFLYAEVIGNNRNLYPADELTVRVISLMEMAYSIGKQDGLKETLTPTKT